MENIYKAKDWKGKEVIGNPVYLIQENYEDGVIDGLRTWWDENIDINPYTIKRKIGKKDINGIDIFDKERFTFDYIEELNRPIKLHGEFIWNDDELRYEIEVFEDEDYTVLSYVSNGVMSNFEIIQS